MRAKLIVGVALATLLAACGNTSSDGRVAMEVSVSGLTAEQNFCFTWQIYQLDEEQNWQLIDQVTEPVCAATGIDLKSSVGTCYAPRRFLVAYEVSFYEGETLLGTASGTSGGTEEDLCEENHDTPTYALFQFGNTGNVGGVNPGVEIDQVCVNDKLEIENGKLISALWMQGDVCGAGAPPDQFCTLGSGSGLTTIRNGLTTDEKIRYIFSESALDQLWDVFYVAFDAEVPANELILQHNPWVLVHKSTGEKFIQDRAEVAYRYDGDTTLVGFVYYHPVNGGIHIVHDNDASCNGPIGLDMETDFIVLPDCAEDPVLLGAVKTGGTGFELFMKCVNGVYSIPCDAAAAGTVCALEETPT